MPRYRQSMYTEYLVANQPSGTLHNQIPGGQGIRHLFSLRHHARKRHCIADEQNPFTFRVIRR